MVVDTAVVTLEVEVMTVAASEVFYVAKGVFTDISQYQSPEVFETQLVAWA